MARRPAVVMISGEQRLGVRVVSCDEVVLNALSTRERGSAAAISAAADASAGTVSESKVVKFVDRHDAEGLLPLEMTVAVNEKTVGRDLLSSMGCPFAEPVAYASRGSVVRPGDVFGSGTCGNGGCPDELRGRTGSQQPPALRPGDVVSMTVEGIGTIRNQVVAAEADAFDIAPARFRPRNRHTANSP